MQVPPPYREGSKISDDVLIEKDYMYFIGYYCYARNRWEIYDDTKQSNIIVVDDISCWWPLPTSGSGIK